MNRGYTERDKGTDREIIRTIRMDRLASIPVVGQHLMYRMDGIQGVCVLLCLVLSECFWLPQSYAS